MFVSVRSPILVVCTIVVTVLACILMMCHVQVDNYEKAEGVIIGYQNQLAIKVTLNSELTANVKKGSPAIFYVDDKKESKDIEVIRCTLSDNQSTLQIILMPVEIDSLTPGDTVNVEIFVDTTRLIDDFY